jgi:type IV pilus assembly protein PilB
MVASSTLLICAQRLARRLCPQCREPVSYPKEQLLSLGYTEADLKLEGFQLYRPVGCSKCSGGHKGRFALLETMRLTEPIRRLIVGRANVLDIKKQAMDEGMDSLRRCGLLNACRGKTSLEEVARSTMQD